MHTVNGLQIWVATLDRRIYAVIVGIVLGVLAGAIGLLTAAAGPVIAVVAVAGLLAGLYILTNVSAALFGVIFVMALLPFGTLPFSIGFVPTLLDVVIGVFVMVYLVMWMTGRRTNFTLTPVHILITMYMLWLLLSFVLGMRYGTPTTQTIRQFAETLLSISMTFILVDLLRDTKALRRLVFVVMLAIGAQATVTIGLYALPDSTAERVLVTLARIGYPNGGVIRYIEDNPALDERAIGTWVDPNALAGILAASASMIAPQVFARRPVMRYRWFAIGTTGIVILALILTYSRASMLGFTGGLGFIAFLRYRRLIPYMIAGILLILLLPQTQDYVARFAQAFTGSDLATQMRVGEYTDSFRLISRYPVFGIGFTGRPEIDIYSDAASTYLIMANQIGLTGLFIYFVTILAVFIYGIRAWRITQTDEQLDSIALGYHAALLTIMINGVADLYFFRLDFQASITLLWVVVSLCLASSRLALSSEQVSKPTVVNVPAFR